MSAAGIEPSITKLYGHITLVFAGLPFLVCAILAVYLAQTENFALVSGVTRKYYLLAECSGRTYALISSIVYVYRPLSLLLLLAFVVSVLLAAFSSRSLLKFVALSSGLFSIPFWALQFQGVLVLSRTPVDVMCRDYPQSLALVLHLVALFIASYVIIGNFVMLLRIRYRGEVK